MAKIFIYLAVAAVLCVPIVKAMRSDKKLTWTNATLLALVLFLVNLLLLGDVPSLILYYFDANNGVWAAKGGIWKVLFSGTLCKAPTCPENYIVVRDVVANTVQGIFFVLICVVIYVWGENRRKAGKFKS